VPEGYRRGDHWLIDDRTGFAIRRSEARKEYTGAIVHKDDFETRHPQEFIKGRRDRQAVKDPRPEPADQFQGLLTTQTTEAANAGDTQLSVDSTARFALGDDVGVFLANGELHRTTLQSVDSAATMTLVEPLPWAADEGARVLNYSAVSGGIGD
jgi:hypothetical protein